MSAENGTFDGGCACGHVRYRVASRPMFVHCCHCRECQRLSGASFAVNALIETDRVTLLQGAVEKVPVPSTSGAGQDIYRCPQCRVAVWSNYLGMRAGAGKKVHFIRVGTLDDPDAMPPDIHIYTESKQHWFALPPDAVTVPTYYDPEKTWPPESLARFSALVTKQ